MSVTNNKSQGRDSRLTFTHGVRALIRAVVFLLKRPKYLGLCLAPWAINLVVLVPLLYCLMRKVIYPWIIGVLPDSQQWWAEALRMSLGVPLAMMLIGLSLLLFLLAAILLGAPFHDKVGELIERERLAHRPEMIAPPTPFWQGVRHSLFEAMRRILIGLPFLLVGFVLGCVPMIGPLLAYLWNGAFGAFFLTLDAFSMPMDRRQIPMGGKWHFTVSNIRFALGFGFPLFVLPCAIFLMPPLAAVGASLVYTDVLLSGEKPEVIEH